MILYIVNVNPEPWAVGPVSVGRRGGKMFPIVGRNQQLDAYKQAVREELESAAQIPMLTGKIHLRFWFWRNRAEYTTPQARLHRKHEADVTNLQKATEDALQGVLFENDRDVVHVESVLVGQGPDVSGKVIIEIEQAPAIADVPDHIVQALIDQARNTSVPDNSWPPREET